MRLPWGYQFPAYNKHLDPSVKTNITEASRKTQKRPTDLWSCEYTINRSKNHDNLNSTRYIFLTVLLLFLQPIENRTEVSNLHKSRENRFIPCLEGKHKMARMCLFHDHFKCKFAENWLIQDMQSSPGSWAVKAKQKSTQQAYQRQQNCSSRTFADAQEIGSCW